MHAATAVAVSQRKAVTVRNGNRIDICVDRDAVAVEVKCSAALRSPCVIKRHVISQIVVACIHITVQCGRCRPCYVTMSIFVCAYCAADGVNMLTFRHRHQCIQRFRNSIKSCHIQLFTLLLGQFRHSLVDGFQLRTDTFCIFFRYCLRKSVNECLHLQHCCLLLIVCPGVLCAGITIADTFSSGIFRTGSFRSGVLIGRSLFPRCRRCFLLFLLLFRRVCFLLFFLLFRRVCFLLFFLFCHRISLLCECCHGQC